ncbi:interferon-related developmental regulator 2-like [Anneissia japonica]|uniref:interferon-related developmental regulator 2-like n=1 Tax=Anneissia japonica TaxID=1529436 RepID=UPI0014255AB9|nr:interferon-related developmental regulator 2-like [Anneissia japonica]
MPRKKRNNKRGGASRGGSEANEEDVENDSGSVTSSHVSDPGSIVDDGIIVGNDGVDESMAQEDFEEKLKEAIDGTTQKSAQGRQKCLAAVQAGLSKKYLQDFVDGRKVTILDCVERCIKKGKGEEQALAANVAGLVFLSLGGGLECQDLFSKLKVLLQTTLADKNASPKARAACATALGLCSFIAAGDMQVVIECMDNLSQVFSASFLKGDGSVPSHSPGIHALHCAALSAWTLLLSIAPQVYIERITYTHFYRLPELLQSEDVNVRIVAGEAIALFYELHREIDEDFVGENLQELLALLKELATDSNKFRAKKDRRTQRSSFRDIIRTIEEYEAPFEQVKFGTEFIEIDSWSRRRQYGVFREALSSGINTHLRENELVRDIFDLGAPVLPLPHSNRGSKFERTKYNAAAFKARTKVRSKQRDKRIAVY